MSAKEIITGEKLVGRVVTLSDGQRGKCACQLVSGEYLLMQGKGGQITGGFFDKDIVSVDK